VEEGVVKNREGQVWRELSAHEDGGQRCIGVVVRSYHDDYLDAERHELMILYSMYELHEGQTQTWNEDELTGDWDAYDGLERVS
jgi:hypothetical protein